MKSSLKYFTFSQKLLKEVLLVIVSVFFSGISIHLINNLLMKQFPLKEELLNTIEPTVYSYTVFLVIIMSAFYHMKPMKWFFFALYIIIGCILFFFTSTLVNVFWL